MIGGTCFGVLVCPGWQDYSNRGCEYRNVSFNSDTLFLLTCGSFLHAIATIVQSVAAPKFE